MILTFSRIYENEDSYIFANAFDGILLTLERQQRLQFAEFMMFFRRKWPYVEVHFKDSMEVYIYSYIHIWVWTKEYFTILWIG